MAIPTAQSQKEQQWGAQPSRWAKRYTMSFASILGLFCLYTRSQVAGQSGTKCTEYKKNIFIK